MKLEEYNYNWHHPLVVHIKRDKYDEYCGRGSIWGNPFIIGKDGSRDEVIEKYILYLFENKELLNKISSFQENNFDDIG